MPAEFDVSEHGMLDEKAIAMTQEAPEKFESNNMLAETLLGLTGYGTRLSGGPLDQASLAVAIQVNYQIALGMDPFTALHTNVGVQGNKGGQSVTYRGFKGPPLVHAQAQKLVTLVLQSIGSGLASYRGSTPGDRVVNNSRNWRRARR